MEHEGSLTTRQGGIASVDHLEIRQIYSPLQLKGSQHEVCHPSKLKIGDTKIHWHLIGSLHPGSTTHMIKMPVCAEYGYRPPPASDEVMLNRLVVQTGVYHDTIESISSFEQISVGVKVAIGYGANILAWPLTYRIHVS
jgi:hypothetical protein